jgi:hypothetical protein
VFKKLVPATIISIVNLHSLLAMQPVEPPKFQVSQTIKKVPTVEEFNTAIEENEFLKRQNANHKMDSNEEKFLENALKYEHSSGGGLINRPLSEFQGNTLVIGGGKKLGDAAVMLVHKPRGRTDLTQFHRDLRALEEGKDRFYRVDGGVNKDSKIEGDLTEEQKEKYKNILK